MFVFALTASATATATPVARTILSGGTTIPLYPVTGGGSTTHVGFTHNNGVTRAVNQSNQQLWSTTGPEGALFGGFDFDQDGWPDAALLVSDQIGTCGVNPATGQPNPLHERRIRSIAGQTGAAQHVVGPMQDYCYPNPGGSPYPVPRWSPLAPIFGEGATFGFTPQYHTQGWFFKYSNGTWQWDALYTPNTVAYDQTYPAAQYNAFNGQTKYRDPSHVFNGIITDVGGEARMVVWTSGRVMQYRANAPLGAQQLAADRPYLTGNRLDAEGRNYGLTIEDPASGYVVLLAGTDASTLLQDWSTCFTPDGCQLKSDPYGGIARHVSIYNPATNLVDDRFYSYANAGGNYYLYRGRLVYPANPLVRIPGPASRLAYNVYADGHWNLHISNPGSTSDRYVIRDRFLWDIRDFDGDGVDEWVTSPICDTPLCPETEGWYLPRTRTEIYRWDEPTQALVHEAPVYEGVLPYLTPTFRQPKVSTSRGDLYPVMSVNTGEGLRLVVTSNGTTPEPADE